MDAKERGLRVVMFPWLAHGHVFPFLEGSAKKQFHIYFCSTPINLESIKQSMKKEEEMGSIQLLQLHLPSLPHLPPHLHTTKNLPPHLIPTLIKAFQMSRSAFSDILTALKPDLLIYDVMQPWSAKIAASHGIPPVHFATSSSTTYAFPHHRHTHGSYATFPYKELRLKEYEIREMRAEAEAIKVEDAGEGIVYGVFQLSHDVVLIKSCRAVEGKCIDYLSTLCKRKLVPTGPLIAFGDNEETADSEIMSWLSQKRERSTLYISFGSENYLSAERIREIAKGLELSGVNFIWVARTPLGREVSIEAALPQGFLSRVEQRGLVVQRWAPQAAILAHPSVGGFMSHCGWSSTTESMYFGVPVVAVPLKLDQPINAKLVVEVMRDENGQFDGNGVAEAIKEVLGEERLRTAARELSEKMKMEEEDAFVEIAQELSKICAKK